jgi:hypothetical protein
MYIYIGGGGKGAGLIDLTNEPPNENSPLRSYRKSFDGEAFNFEQDEYKNLSFINNENEAVDIYNEEFFGDNVDIYRERNMPEKTTDYRPKSALPRLESSIQGSVQDYICRFL